ncbi:MAG: NADH-quinone oxidoreductase subunit NuoH [Chloroflexota bacterium]
MFDPINSIARWLAELLAGWGLSSGLVSFLMTLIGVLVISIFVLLVDIFLVWLERKVVARFQDRLGPNRLGPFGLIQPFADVIKLLIKEDTTPEGADRVLYNLAPVMALASVLLLWAVIPLAPNLIGTNLDVGVLYIIAAGAIGLLGIIMAGWASNNKFALLGAVRVVALAVTYEVPMVVALLIPVILARSMSLYEIVAQQEIAYIIAAPVAAFIFLLAGIAELGRAPFDLAEAESEIVAGYNIEYSGMKFGLFYAGELLHALTIGALFATFFLGGWRGWGAEAFPLLGILWLFLKALFIYWVIMWVRYSLPRFRIDHMLGLSWKVLTPLALVALMATAFMDKLLVQLGLPAGGLVYSLAMFLVNVLIIWGALAILRSYASAERRRVAEPKPVASPELSGITRNSL